MWHRTEPGSTSESNQDRMGRLQVVDVELVGLKAVFALGAVVGAAVVVGRAMLAQL